jgi:hypothetical protein
MLNDDLNRRNDLNRGNGVDTRDKAGAMIIGALAVAAVIGALFMWAPWSGDRTASNTSPGTTVGSTANRPAAPASPGAPAPAAPSNNR